MSGLTSVGEARLLAVCDLLAEPVAHLDPPSIAFETADLTARMTSSGLAVVHIAGPDGEVAGYYPGPVDPAVIAALKPITNDAPWMVVDEHDLRPHAAAGGPLRAVGFTAGDRYRGFVASLEPVIRGFDAIDEWLLMVTARRIAAQLELVLLHRDGLARQQFENDARLAGEIQRLMLGSNDAAPGIDIAGLARPARHVGGDLFGWHSDRWGTSVAVADVSGKGAAAALLMASIQASIRQGFAVGVAEPVELIEWIRSGSGILLERASRLVTVAAVRIERGGLCSIASAGHSPVIVRSQGVARMLLPTSPPLGVPGSSARGEQLRLAPGDVVVVGTDGLIDQRDPSGMSYGPERLLALVAGAAGSAADMADSIFSALDRFAGDTPQEDDQALVVINEEAGAW